MDGVMVPIVMFVAIAVTVCAYFWLGYRTRAGVQETIQAAIEHGQALTPELIERLGARGRAPEADLRKGVVLIAIGLGFAAFGGILGEEDAIQPLIAMGAVPLLIGVAYVGLWRFLPQR